MKSLEYDVIIIGAGPGGIFAAYELMHYVDRINMEHGGAGTKLYSTAGTKFKKLCVQNDLHLLDASVLHLGTAMRILPCRPATPTLRCWCPSISLSPSRIPTATANPSPG